MRLWMRWGAVAFGVALALVPGTGQAEEQQPQPPRRTVLMMHPLAGITASVEHAVSERVALVGMARVITQLDNLTFGSDLGGDLRLGGGLEPGVHYYVAGRAPEGFWVGAHLEAFMMRQGSTTSHIVLPNPEGGFSRHQVRNPGWTELEYGGSARVGYTAILSPGFSVQGGVGLSATYRAMSGFGYGLGWRVGPRVLLGLGWAF